MRSYRQPGAEPPAAARGNHIVGSMRRVPLDPETGRDSAAWTRRTANGPGAARPVRIRGVQAVAAAAGSRPALEPTRATGAAAVGPPLPQAATSVAVPSASARAAPRRPSPGRRDAGRATGGRAADDRRSRSPTLPRAPESRLRGSRGGRERTDGVPDPLLTVLLPERAGVRAAVDGEAVRDAGGDELPVQRDVLRHEVRILVAHEEPEGDRPVAAEHALRPADVAVDARRAVRLGGAEL